jgi:hypothetical protein
VRADPALLNVEAHCRMQEHPHRQAHYSWGITEHGIRWSIFWWQAGADPDSPAASDPDAS